ncbi:MAG: ATP-binding cassette domain-containing protein, partial [Rhodospirillaceae bacterium]|nr:ATP-binding cassette domain-containing protein [Rhodospirillaceae bacterium]
MSTTDNDPVLDIRDLSVSFNTARGSLCALRHVDITVPQNKIVGIVGESGCGKSTLINSVLRLLSPNSEVNAESEVIFQGDDVMKMDNASLQGLRGQ